MFNIILIVSGLLDYILLGIDFHMSLHALSFHENFANDLCAEHVYVDVPKPAQHHLYCLHQQHQCGTSGMTGLLKSYLLCRQHASDNNDNTEMGPESDVALYLDIVPASKYRLLVPLVAEHEEHV
jgi:hypothetical protein